MVKVHLMSDITHGYPIIEIKDNASITTLLQGMKSASSNYSDSEVMDENLGDYIEIQLKQHVASDEIRIYFRFDAAADVFGKEFDSTLHTLVRSHLKK